MAKGDEIPRTTPDEIENLIEQIRGTNLEPGSKDKLERLLRTILSLVDQLQRKKTSINKLREMVFGKRTERRSGGKGGGEKKESESAQENESGQPPDEQASAAGAPAAQGEARTGERAEQPKRKGHGHRAAAAYSGARLVPCPHEQFKPGDDCPATLCGGRLYDLDEPTVLLQFTGQPLLTATNYARQVLRCAKCQERYEAPLPAGVQDERYDATCDATIALLKYGGGLPWTRQAGLQEMGGVPLSEATLWERCEATADAALGVYQQLLRLAANGELLHTDDTWVRILSCLQEDEEKKGRATQTSGIVAQAAGRKIALYFSGRQHAGENLAELLKRRDKELGRPFQMSDALAANSSGGHDVVHVFCLAHARRTVYELEDSHPAACKVVLDAVGAVYGYDEQTVGLSPEQRLLYHQEKSGPVMAELKEWIETQFAERLVEPNSNLGKALQYWRNHWEKLTVWLREPGAPLDNNAAERALKRFILLRKNSLFFKTEHGAAVGDMLAALIQTCRLNGVNAWDYLVTIIRNRSDARRNPQLYLPWNYKGEAAAAEALAA